MYFCESKLYIIVLDFSYIRLPAVPSVPILLVPHMMEFELHERYHRTRGPGTMDVAVAANVTGLSIPELLRLQASCDAYSLRQPVMDLTTDFLFCGKCAVAVHAFKNKQIQQFACLFCSRFLCIQCNVCGCGVKGELVSTGDLNTGRISEYCVKSLIHGCDKCDAFFYNRRDFVLHQIRHTLSDTAKEIIVITKSSKIANVGTIIIDANAVRATFAPYPRRLTINGESSAGFSVRQKSNLTTSIKITAVLTDPELSPSNHRRCSIVVAHLSRFLQVNPNNHELLPRPICFLDPNATAISVDELKTWGSIINEYCSVDTVQLVFYIPPSQDGSTDGFCLRVLDIPWQQFPVVVCPGCGEWFTWTSSDDICRHININRDYILSTAVRVNPDNGQFFQFSNACARYAHASNLSNGLLHQSTTIPPITHPSKLCFGAYVTPVKSRARFIGVIVTDTSIICMHCAERITSRTGHTSTSMLFPLANHWHLPESDIILFRCTTGAAESITSIM